MKTKVLGLVLSLIFSLTTINANATIAYSASAPVTGTQINLGSTAISAFLTNQTFGIATFNGGAIGLASGSDYSGTAAAPAGVTGAFWTIGTSGYNTNYGSSPLAGSGSISFSQALSSFTFQWGSPDSYNTVEYFSGNKLLGSFTGSAVPTGYGNGDRSISAFATFTTNALNPITEVKFFSNGNAFETASFSYVALPVPEPQTYAMLLIGLGLIGFIRFRHKTNA
jgi:hypothetical protein